MGETKLERASSICRKIIEMVYEVKPSIDEGLEQEEAEEKREEKKAKINVVEEENENPVVSGAEIVCTNMANPGLKVYVLAKPPAYYNDKQGSLALRDTDTRIFPSLCFGVCKNLKTICRPLIEGERWQECSLNKINGREGVTMNSFMVCIKGEGVITPKTDGQVVGEVSENTSVGYSENLVLFLEMIEIGKFGEGEVNHTLIYDEDGNILGIKIQNAQDGYVTVGFGSAIQSEEEAIKYGFDSWTKQDVSVIDEKIKNQIEEYGDGIQNPAILSMEEAETILALDLMAACDTVAKIFAGKGIDREILNSPNKMDAIISNVFNTGGEKYGDKDTLLYYFLENDQEKAMGVIHKGVKQGWYKNKEGLFRRRLMEYNIFFNGDYTFYDSDELEELKEVTGFNEHNE